jgi:hypothetical protein
MDAEAIRDEIERRRQRAIDLELRETVYSLYKAHFQFYEKWLRGLVDLTYPDIRAGFKCLKDGVCFEFAGFAFDVLYSEREKDPEAVTDFDHRSRCAEVTLSLMVDRELVFEFLTDKIVRVGEGAPDFQTRFGRVLAFKEGPWARAVKILLERIEVHEEKVREPLKNSPSER